MAASMALPPPHEQPTPSAAAAKEGEPAPPVGAAASIATGEAPSSVLHVLVLCAADYQSSEVPVFLAPESTVAHIKAVLHNVKGIAPARQRLTVEGSTRPLADNATLASIGISSGARLHLQVEPHNGEQPSAAGSQPQTWRGFARPIQSPRHMFGFFVPGPPTLSMPPPVSEAEADWLASVYGTAFMVQLFAVIDSAFLLFLSFFMWPLLAALLLCVAGVYGAHSFSPFFLILYGIYTFGSIALRVYAMLELNRATYFLVVMSLGILVQLIVLSLILYLVFSLFQLSQPTREALHQLNHLSELPPIIIANRSPNAIPRYPVADVAPHIRVEQPTASTVPILPQPAATQPATHPTSQSAAPPRNPNEHVEVL